MPNLIAQALAPLAGAAVITSGGTSTMFVVLTGIVAVNVILVGVLWFVVDGRHGDDQPSATHPRLEQG